MFRYIADIIAQFSASQKIIALLLILFSITIISVSPLLIQDKNEMIDEINKKNSKILILEKEIEDKDTKIRDGQKSCTNQIIEREKEFISMLDQLKNKALKEDNTVINQMNYESYPIGDSTGNRKSSTIIIKNDMKSMIKEIDIIKGKINQ